MERYGDPAESYIKVNAARLAMLDAKAENILATDALAVEYDLFSQQVVRAEGLATPDVVTTLLDDSDDQAYEKAVKITISLNEANMAVAAMSVHGLYARTCIRYLSALDDETAKTLATSPRPVKLVAGPGLYRERTFERDDKWIHVVTTEIAEIEHFGSVKETTISLADETLEQKLMIITSGRQVIDILEVTESANSDLVERFLNVLSKEAATEVITHLIIGKFKDETELDARLDGIRSNYKGGLQDSELEQLLSAIRQRSLAAKHASELTKIFGEGKPSADKLDEFEAILDSLS